MGGIHIDMEAMIQRMTDDFNDLFGPLGIFMVVGEFKPRRSFWQQLKHEIANRPRVF